MVNKNAVFPVTDVLAASVAIHRQQGGFVKKNSATPDRPSNSSLIYDHFFDDNLVVVTEEDCEQAAEVRQYLMGLAVKAFSRDLSDFEQNVLGLLQSDTVDRTKMGIAASLPSVFERHCEQDMWSIRERALSVTSEYVGKIRERILLSGLVVENVRHITKTKSYLACLSYDNKHIVKMFCQHSLRIGDVVNCSGNVKSQEISKYHRGMETMLNHVRIQSVNGERQGDLTN